MSFFLTLFPYSKESCAENLSFRKQGIPNKLPEDSAQKIVQKNKYEGWWIQTVFIQIRIGLFIFFRKIFDLFTVYNHIRADVYCIAPKKLKYPFLFSQILYFHQSDEEKEKKFVLISVY